MEAGEKSQSQPYSLSADPGLSYVTPANLEVPAWKFCLEVPAWKLLP